MTWNGRVAPLRSSTNRLDAPTGSREKTQTSILRFRTSRYPKTMWKSNCSLFHFVPSLRPSKLTDGGGVDEISVVVADTIHLRANLHPIHSRLRVAATAGITLCLRPVGNIRTSVRTSR